MIRVQQLWQKPNKGSLKQLLYLASIVAAIIPTSHSTTKLTAKEPCVTFQSKNFPGEYERKAKEIFKFRGKCHSFEIFFSNVFDIDGNPCLNCEEQDFVQIQPGIRDGKKSTFDETQPKHCGQCAPSDATFLNFNITNRIVFRSQKNSKTGLGFQARVCMICEEPTSTPRSRTNYNN